MLTAALLSTGKKSQHIKKIMNGDESKVGFIMYNVFSVLQRLITCISASLCPPQVAAKVPACRKLPLAIEEEIVSSAFKYHIFIQCFSVMFGAVLGRLLCCADTLVFISWSISIGCLARERLQKHTDCSPTPPNV